MCIGVGDIGIGEEMQREAERGSFFRYLSWLDSVERGEEEPGPSPLSTDSLETNTEGIWLRRL